MLDVRMIKKAGLEVAKEYDFRDDGAYFRGFKFITENLEIVMTYTSYDGCAYLSARLDYKIIYKGQIISLMFRDYKDSKAFELEDRFNGVNAKSVTYEEFEAWLVEFTKAVEELLEKLVSDREEIEKTEVDMTEVKNKMKADREFVNDLMARFVEKSMTCTTVEYTERASFLMRYMLNFVKNVNLMEEKIAKLSTNLEKAELKRSFEENGYLTYFSKYDMEKVEEFLNK